MPVALTQTVANAVETFAATLETHRWLPTSAASRARQPAQVAFLPVAILVVFSCASEACYTC